MKKGKIIGLIFTACFACTFTSAYARMSGYNTVTTFSNNEVLMGQDQKDTNIAQTGAFLRASGAPDTIYFYAYDVYSGTTLTTFPVTESSTPMNVTSNVGYYWPGNSGAAGKMVRVTGKSKEFSITGFPINVNVNFN